MLCTFYMLTKEFHSQFFYNSLIPRGYWPDILHFTLCQVGFLFLVVESSLKLWIMWTLHLHARFKRFFLNYYFLRHLEERVEWFNSPATLTHNRPTLYDNRFSEENLDMHLFHAVECFPLSLFLYDLWVIFPFSGRFCYITHSFLL